MPRVYPGLTRGPTGEAEDRRLQGKPWVFPPLGPLFRLHEGVQGLLEGFFRKAPRRLQGLFGGVGVGLEAGEVLLLGPGVFPEEEEGPGEEGELPGEGPEEPEGLLPLLLEAPEAQEGLLGVLLQDGAHQVKAREGGPQGHHLLHLLQGEGRGEEGKLLQLPFQGLEVPLQGGQVLGHPAREPEPQALGPVFQVPHQVLSLGGGEVPPFPVPVEGRPGGAWLRVQEEDGDALGHAFQEGL
mgnify:FL=1